MFPYKTNNCFDDNVDSAGKVTISPSNLPAVCGKPWDPSTALEVALTEELGCASVGLSAGLPFPFETAAGVSGSNPDTTHAHPA